MFERILKDRLTSMEKLTEKLKEDKRKLTRYEKSEDTFVQKKVTEFEKTIEEVLEFMNDYKDLIINFLNENELTMNHYNAQFSGYDAKFLEVLKSIQDKEDIFKQSTNVQ